MRARIVDYNYIQNRAVFEFDVDFSEHFDKFNGKDVNMDLKVWKPKRSGAANRYMWVLVDKIAQVKHITKEEVYRQEIKEIGGVSTVLLMIDEAVERFCKDWDSRGVGWQTEVIPIGDGRSNVIAYYGSSTFDRDQMTQLIENLIFEAENLGIDTDTPDKALWWESLEEEYDRRKSN